MKILFVCEGNINRSQMAGTFLKSFVPDADVTTAGVYAASSGKLLAHVSRESIAVMEEIGFDMSKNLIHQLTPQMVKDADRVVLVGPVPAGPLPEYLKNSENLETWDVPDPGYGHISLPDARDMVLKYVKDFASKLKTSEHT